MYGVISMKMFWVLRKAEKLQYKGSTYCKYDRQKGSQMKLSDIMKIQMTQCSLGGSAVGRSCAGGIDHATGRDNWAPLAQPCFLHPNLTAITQLSLELCQAGCPRRSRSAEQMMWTVTTQSPASGKGCKRIKDFRSLILPTTSPIIKLSFHLKLTLHSSDNVSAIPTFECLFFQQQNQLFPGPNIWAQRHFLNLLVP